MSDAIAALANRFWSVHPKEIQDLGITREQFYEREMRALFTTQATARIEALEAEVEKWHRVAMKAGAITCTGGGHIYPLRDRIEALEAALRQVIDSVHDYERANNLAPTPPRTECWDSVAHAIKVLAGSQDK